MLRLHHFSRWIPMLLMMLVLAAEGQSGDDFVINVLVRHIVTASSRICEIVSAYPEHQRREVDFAAHIGGGVACGSPLHDTFFVSFKKADVCLLPQLREDFFYDASGIPYIPQRGSFSPLSLELLVLPRNFSMGLMLPVRLVMAEVERGGAVVLRCGDQGDSFSQALHEHRGFRSAIDMTQRLRAKRAFKVNAAVDSDSRLIHLPPFQGTGPVTTQFNVVFLPSGFVDAELVDFTSVASVLFRLLQSPEYPTLQETFSFLRFVPHMNFFATFVESFESGVSDVTQGITRDTAMRCSLMPQRAQFDGRLRCTTDIVAAFAATTPASPHALASHTLTVVIVNSVQRVAGVSHMGAAQLYLSAALVLDAAVEANDAAVARKTLLNVFAHAIGHAVFALSDEIDVAGAAPAVPRQLKNCAAPGGPIPWSQWIVQQRLDPLRFQLSGGEDTSLDEDPTAPCEYSSYVRPSAKCLMGQRFFVDPGSTGLFFCPVCMGHITEQFLGTLETLRGVQPTPPTAFTEVPFIFWPVCPLPAEIVITTVHEYITVSINRFLTRDRGFAVRWIVGNETIARDVTFTVLEIVTMVELSRNSNFDVRVEVEDLRFDEFVINGSEDSSRLASKLYHMRFAIQVVANPATIQGWQTRRCEHPLFAEQSPPFRALCVSPIGCEVNYTTLGAVRSPSRLQALQQNAGIIIAILLVLCVVVAPWALFAKRHYHKVACRTRDIRTLHLRLGLEASDRVFRNIVLLTALVVLLCALSSVLTAIKLYVITETITLVILMVLLAGAIVTQTVGYAGFSGALGRSPVRVFIAAAVYTLLCIVMVAFVAAFDKLDEYLSDPDGETADDLERAWLVSVRDYPTTACEFQEQFECSGWRRACLSANASDTCPRGCAANTRYGIPCSSVALTELRRRITFLHTIVRVAIPWLLITTAIHLRCGFVFRRVRRKAQQMIARGAQRPSLIPDQRLELAVVASSSAPASGAKPTTAIAVPSTVASHSSSPQCERPSLDDPLGELDYLRFLREQDDRRHAVQVAQSSIAELIKLDQRRTSPVCSGDLQTPLLFASSPSPQQRTPVRKAGASFAL